MVSQGKWIILTPLLVLPKNGEDWGKLIVAKGFKKLPKILSPKSGHFGWQYLCESLGRRPEKW